jgi:hypothetical protein
VRRCMRSSIPPPRCSHKHARTGACSGCTHFHCRFFLSRAARPFSSPAILLTPPPFTVRRLAQPLAVIRSTHSCRAMCHNQGLEQTAAARCGRALMSHRGSTPPGCPMPPSRAADRITVRSCAPPRSPDSVLRQHAGHGCDSHLLSALCGCQVLGSQGACGSCVQRSEG